MAKSPSSVEYPSSLTLPSTPVDSADEESAPKPLDRSIVASVAFPEEQLWQAKGIFFTQLKAEVDEFVLDSKQLGRGRNVLFSILLEGFINLRLQLSEESVAFPEEQLWQAKGIFFTQLKAEVDEALEEYGKEENRTSNSNAPLKTF
jgi:hypothetical protein